MPADTTSAYSKGVWLITGCSSGFGREIALAVLAAGGRVVATARNLASLQPISAAAPDRVLALPLDVTQPAQIAAAVASATGRFGAIDVVVNNAGYGLIGSVEEMPEREYRAQFEVNFFGLVAVTRALLPAMRARRRGSIVNISSVAGMIGHPGSSFYSASKFAVEGFSEGLRAELAPFGVHVMTVEPGFFRTEFGNTAIHRPPAIADYEASVGKTMAMMAQMRGVERGDPQRAAVAILAAVDRASPPAQLPLGGTTVGNIERKLAAQREAFMQLAGVAAAADFPS